MPVFAIDIASGDLLTACAVLILLEIRAAMARHGIAPRRAQDQEVRSTDGPIASPGTDDPRRLRH